MNSYLLVGLILLALLAIMRGLISSTFATKLIEDGLNSSNVYSGNWKTLLNFSINTGSLNVSHDVVFTRANLQLLWIVSTQNITLYTNATSGGSPGNTFALQAGVPLIISPPEGYFAATELLAADVTHFYWSNTSGNTATVTGEVISL